MRRRQARKQLLDFTCYTKHDYEVNWHHRLLCSWLDRFIAGEVENLAISMPPRHGKTELVTRRLIPYLLGRNPDQAIIFCTHTASLAGDECLNVQSILESAEYLRLFPRTRIWGRNSRVEKGRNPQRNRDVIEILGRQGSLRAAGIGTGIAGRGFRFGIIDDPFPDQASADSPTQRNAIWRWYTADFMSRALPGAQVLLCMTRRNEEDLVGQVLKLSRDDPRARKWQQLILPALKIGELPDDPRQPGEPLWPGRYSPSFLEAKRIENERDFASNYQQDPRPPGSTEWPDSYFDGPGFWFDDWPPAQELEVSTMALDPSKGTDSRLGDYQALVKYGRDRNSVEYVEADLSRRPMTAPRSADGKQLAEGMIEFAVEWISQFQPNGFGLETNQFQILLKLPLLEELKRRRIEVPLFEINNTENKVMRIRRLGPALAQRKLRFRTTLGTRKLVEQLRQFPVGEHDDGPDALEMARRLGVRIYNSSNS